MDDLMARTMVENLSIGINPLDGRALSKQDVCSDPVVQEAIKTVLEHCTLDSYATMLEKHYQEKREKEKQKKEERRLARASAKKSVENHRVKNACEWTERDDWKLLAFCNNGYDAAYIARIMQYDISVIREKMKKRYQ